MGSVQLQTVPCSSLYFFSRPTGPFHRLVSVSHRVLTCCTCHFQSFSLFLYFGSSVCMSLQCLISTLTEEGGGGQVFRLTCSVVLWGGRITANKSHWCVGSARSVWATPGLPPLMAACAFPVYTAQAPGCSAGVLLCFVHLPGLSRSGSGFGNYARAQRLLDVYFVPFPGRSSSGDQVLGECPVPGGPHVLITSPVPAAWFPGCAVRANVSGVFHVFSGELISGCNPPSRCQSSRIPGRLG